MTNDMRHNTLKSICIGYLRRLRYLGKKHGIDVDGLIRQTKDEKCKPTEHEVELLSRAVNDERLKRTEVPPILGKTYRECFDDDDFDNINKLPTQGIYSKVSTLLYASKKQSN